MSVLRLETREKMYRVCSLVINIVAIIGCVAVILSPSASAQTTVAVSSTVETPGIDRPGINLGGLAGYGSQQLFKSLNYVNGGYFPGTYAATTYPCRSGGSNTTTSWYNDVTNPSGYPANFWAGATFVAINSATGTSYGSGTVTASTANTGAAGITFTLSPAISSACNPSQNDVLVVRLLKQNTLISPYQLLNNHICSNATWDTSDTSPASTNSQQSLEMPNGCGLTFYIDATISNRTNSNPGLTSQQINFINLNGSYTATFKAKCLVSGCSMNFNLGRAGGTTFVGSTSVSPSTAGPGAGWTTYNYPFSASEVGPQGQSIILNFTCTGTCLLQDADVIEGSTLAGNTTVFRDAVVYELQKIHPGSIRYMDPSQWCADVADEIAATGNRRWCGVSQYAPGGVGQAMGYSDVLTLANLIGSDVLISVGQLNQPSDWTTLINWLNSSGWISTYAAAGHTIYLEDGNEAWNSGASGSLSYGVGPAYGYTLGINMAAAKAAAGYNPSVIKLVGDSFAAGGEGYGTLGWVQGVLTVAQGIQNGLPDFVDVAPYTLNYLGNFNSSGNNVATTGAPFLDEWAENANIDSVTSPPPYTQSMYLNQQYVKSTFGVDTLVYEVNESTNSGVAATQLQLDQIDASVGNALSTAEHVLLMQRDSHVTGPIHVFTLAEPYTGYSCSGCGGVVMPLWGANIFMATGPGQTPGVANVDRPLAIAMEVIDNAIGSNNNLMSVTQSGTPTFSYPGGQDQSGSHSILSNSAVPYVNCFAYSDGKGNWTTICFNNNLTTAESVALAGAGAPTGSVSETIFPGPSNVITDNNENTYLGGSTAPVVTLPSATTASGRNYSIPPASFIALTYTVSGIPTLSTPTFSPGAGNYSATQTVNISFPSGSTGCVGINTMPTTSTPGTCGAGGATYTGAITVSASETLNAIATEAGYSNSATATAAYTIVNGAVPTVSTSCYRGSGASSLALGPIDTSGAGAIAVVVASFNNILTVTDNKGNGNATGLTAASGGSPNNQIFYWQTPKVGAGHTITVNGGGGLYASACVFVMSGVSGTYSGAQNANAAGYASSSCQTGITPASGPQVILAGFGVYTPYGLRTIDSSFTLGAYEPGLGGTAFGEATGYLIQPSGTTTSPKWNWGNNATTPSCVIAAFGGATGVPAAATPTFSPAAGTYSSAQSVSISDTTAGTTIYYTTNGTAPTTSSSIYSGPITVSATETLEAIAVETGYSNSAPATAAYTINQVVAVPTFSPAGGSYTPSQPSTAADYGLHIHGDSISVGSGSGCSDSALCYNGLLDTEVGFNRAANANDSNGGDQSEDMNVRVFTDENPTATNNPIQTTLIGTNDALYAGSAAGYLTTFAQVQTATHAWLALPNTSKIAGNLGSVSGTCTADTTYANITGEQCTASNSTVTWSNVTAPNGVIYLWYRAFQTSTGTAACTIDSSPATDTLTSSTTLIAQALVGLPTNHGLTNDVQLARFTGYSAGSPHTIVCTNSNTFTYVGLGLPPAARDAGLYAPTVAMGGVIYYQNDGSSALTAALNNQSGSVASLLYGDGLNVLWFNPRLYMDSNCDMGTPGTPGCPKSTGPPFHPSDVGHRQLANGFETTLNVLTTPASLPVAINDATSGAAIYYTTDGSTPNTASTLYTGPIRVSGSETLNAIAVGAGATTSATASTVYTITKGATLPAPTFTPAAGTYTSSQSVTISDATSGTTIYYTTNGTTPTTSSSVYGGAITVLSSETLEAIAVETGYTTSATATAVYTISPVLAAPSFAPAAGTYTTSQSVTIGDAAGTTIYYTTNGTTPTTSSNVYGGAITVSSSETLEAIAVETGYTTSATAIATYTINPVLPAPTFSLATGTYTTSQSVTISDATTGTTIYYTTNGTTPTTSSNVYTGAIIVAATETLEAIAAKSGYATSAAASATYTIAAGSAPSVATSCYQGSSASSLTLGPINTSGASAIAIVVASFNNILTVTDNKGNGNATGLAAASGGSPNNQIFYWQTPNVGSGHTITVNGGGGLYASACVFVMSGVSGTYSGVQSASSAGYGSSTCQAGSITPASGPQVIITGFGVYAPTGIPTLDSSYTVGTYQAGAGGTAFGEAAGYLIQPAGAATNPKWNWGNNAATPSCVIAAFGGGTGVPAAATPTFSPGAGTYTSAQPVTINETTAGTTIYYTTNGTTPTTSSSVYGGPITVSASETLQAIAVETGYTTSAAATAAYIISPILPAPTFSLAAGTYATSQSVILNDTAAGATIYYTTNGTTPTTSSSVYSGAITVSASETLEAIAVETGYTTSSVATAAYTINSILPAPSFSPAGGTYTSQQSVTIGDATAATTIYYTTNGTTPTTSSSVYGGPITVAASETLEAIAVKSGYTTSAVGTAAYTIATGSAPTVSTACYQGSSSSSLTIGPINTTGANAIAIVVASFNNILTVTDNKGNGNATGLVAASGGSPNNQIFYWQNPSVGSGHTITINGGGGLYASACVFVMSGVSGAYSGAQSANSAGYGSSTCQTGITPASGPQVVITGFGVYSPTGIPTLDSSYTLGAYQAGTAGSAFGEAAGYLIQPAGAATNPQWNWVNGATSPSCVIAAFR